MNPTPAPSQLSTAVADDSWLLGLEGGDAISLAALIVTVAVSIGVPHWTMRATARQTHDRWVLEHRAEFYEEMLAFCTRLSEAADAATKPAATAEGRAAMERRAMSMQMTGDQAATYTARIRMWSSDGVTARYWAWYDAQFDLLRTMMAHQRSGLAGPEYVAALEEAKAPATKAYTALHVAVRRELAILSEPEVRWWRRFRSTPEPAKGTNPDGPPDRR